jgi:hypothetical protein
MKLINRSSKRLAIANKHKLNKFVGCSIAFIVIAFFCFNWIVGDKKEVAEVTDIPRNNKVTIVEMPAGKKLSNYSNIIDSDKAVKFNGTKYDRTEKETIERGVAPDELIQGVSANELDVFHKKQAKIILKELSNPETTIELPPSGDSLVEMQLKELDAFHKQQAISLKSDSIEFVQLFLNEATGGSQAGMSRNEIDLLHREQFKQSRADNERVSLPSFAVENKSRPLTMKELDVMIHREQLAAEFAEVDDKAPIVLPPSSDEPHALTNWDLIELHAKQHELSIK